jgi:protein SCO1/2
MRKSFGVTTLLFFSLLTGCSLLAPPPEFRGALYGEPAPPPSFSLAATSGETFSLRDQENKVTLLFFGYTNCPDICPVILGTIKTALNQMEAEEREQVQLVFISVDPASDTLDRIGGYLARYNSGYIGVAPDETELEQMLADYGSFAEAEPPDADSGGYLVTHTGLTYVIDKAGNLRLGFFTDMAPEDIAHDLRILVGE